MPYIKKENRPVLDAVIEPILVQIDTWTEGDFNYVISSILWEYFLRHTGYGTINKIIGILECVKLEFYARMARPYEEEKMLENGDILNDDI